MFTLSPFSPVQYYEQVQPAPRVRGADERFFPAPEQDSAASRKRKPSQQDPSPQLQPLTGFGASATLLSPALLAELGRQAALPAQPDPEQQEATTEEAAEDRKKKSSNAGADSVDDAVGADQIPGIPSADVIVGFGADRTEGAAATASALAQNASAANENTANSEPDRSLFLLRLQRAKSVYAQGQMASTEYAFARTAEVFQMVA